MRARRIRDAVPEHHTEAELDALEVEAHRALEADMREGELMPRMPATCPRGCGRKVHTVYDEAGQPWTVERDDRYGTLIAKPYGDDVMVHEGTPHRDDPRYCWHTHGVQRGKVTLMRFVCGKSLEESIAITFGSDDGERAFGRGEQ